MERHSIWPVVCACLWTFSVTLMLVASFTGGQLRELLALWSLLIGMAAGTTCCKAAISDGLRRERMRIEELAAIMAREALSRQDGEVRSFHR